MKTSYLYIINILVFILVSPQTYAKKAAITELVSLDMLHKPTIENLYSVIAREPLQKHVHEKLNNSRKENEELKKRIHLMLKKVKQQKKEIEKQERINASLSTSDK